MRCTRDGRRSGVIGGEGRCAHRDARSVGGAVGDVTGDWEGEGRGSRHRQIWVTRRSMPI